MVGETVSHYRIVSRLGSGGMGVVYLAEDTHLARQVAIKFSTAAPEDGQYRARFLREARAASALNHPHIARIYDYGETAAGQPFIVMELVAGEDLSRNRKSRLHPCPCTASGWWSLNRSSTFPRRRKCRCGWRR